VGFKAVKEIELFNWLKKYKYPDLERSTDQYDCFDCISPSNQMLIELKCRAVHYDQLILEKPKWQSLTLRAEAMGYTAWYINQTPLGVSYHNLTALTDAQWVKKELPKSTQFDNKTKVVKEITFLKINR
jgi:hypothetical protein